MSEAANAILAEQALTVLRRSLPAGSYILFTPDDGMVVSPDPEDIKRIIDTLISHAKGAPAMEDIDSAIDQAFDEWVSTQGLEHMTNRDIYEAGFRHGHEIGKGSEASNG